jgi:pimeloyl-ACP methyl ester carboxylesterase
MNRRTMLAAPLAAPLLVASVAQAQAALVTEEFMIPSGDAGIELFLRNKRPENLTSFSPARTVIFVHGATYPAHTAFDLPLGGLSWMDYIAGQGFDVWCLDIRGYGRSTRPPEMNQPPEANPPIVRGETAVKDIGTAAAFIRERRNVAKLVHIGWSWGSTLMGRFAADNPALVERLVLFAPPWLRDQSLNFMKTSMMSATLISTSRLLIAPVSFTMMSVSLVDTCPRSSSSIISRLLIFRSSIR